MKQLVVIEVVGGVMEYYVTVRITNRPTAQVLQTANGGEVILNPPIGLSPAATLYFPENAFQVRNILRCIYFNYSF